MALVVSSNAERLRFDRLWDASEDALDFTSGRLELNRYALDQIGERPFRGQGFGVPLKELSPGYPLEIHNMWLRAGAEGGLIYLAGTRGRGRVPPRQRRGGRCVRAWSDSGGRGPCRRLLPLRR